MKVLKLIDQPSYNHWGCGRRLQFLIEYNNKKRLNLSDNQIVLQNGFKRLNKLVDYYNYHGNLSPIIKQILYTPITIKEIEKQ